MLREDLKSISTEYLRDTSQISIRSANCCLREGLDNFYKIFLYFEENGSFTNKKIRNAGLRTCQELDELCTNIIPRLKKREQHGVDKHISDVLALIRELSEEEREMLLSLANLIVDPVRERAAEIEKLVKSNPLDAIAHNLIGAKDIISFLDESQLVSLENIFLKQIEKYTVRTQNRLKLVGIKDFILDYLFESDKMLLNIGGLGKKSLVEAVELKDVIRYNLLKQIMLPEDELTWFNLIHNKNEIFQNEFVSDFYQENKHFPMFWILEQMLINQNEREINILIDTFPIFQNSQPNTLKEVADKYDISRERVRQIRNNTYNKTFEITNDVTERRKNCNLNKYTEIIQNKSDWEYLLTLFEGVNVITQENAFFFEQIKKEQSNLSVEFVRLVIANVFRDVFIFYGNDFDINNRGFFWKSKYLIRRAYTVFFDFEKMREEFENILIENETEFLLDIEIYISNSQCWKIFDYDKINSIVDITKIMLLHEFGLYSDEIHGQIKIPANKEKKPINVVYDILKQNERPMHLMEIFSEFKSLLPKHKYTIENNPDKLRPSLQRHEDITFVNRKSVYTLKEWKHIPKGTIRNKIVEFLDKKDIPQTVESITDYVNLSFQTAQKNVHSSMHSGKYFVQFKGNLFGLKSKQYSPEFKKMTEKENKKRNFEQRLNDLEIFIVENEHFPFSVSENYDEISLYRWWALIEQGRKKLSENQYDEVIRIQKVYSDYKIDKDTYKWNLTYNKLKIFLIENKRQPSRKGEEKSLYTWLYKIKDDFLNNRLTEEQRRKYIELVKLI